MEALPPPYQAAEASRMDSSPPQARKSPPTKQDILATAQKAIDGLNESLQSRLKSSDVDEETKAAVAKSLNQTCDVHLGSLNLHEIPPEITDIISQGITRITFAHNRLTSISNLSSGFANCVHLKYLVLRSNELREFPQACFSLPNLELLDLKKNFIASLPEDLDRMTKLRVLSVVRNRIRTLPVCIAKMRALQQFATRRNPIDFPPKEHWAIESTPEDEGKGDDRGNDREKTRDMAETVKIKKFLQQHVHQEQAQKEGENDISESNLETPRPARRKASGRFPIKPSVSGVDNNSEPRPESPVLTKPPPLPSKSFARSAVQPISAAIRPGVAPLITSKERNRSNSESQMPTSVREKRMGIIPRKTMDSDRLEIRKSSRLSHLRGLSHGSALQNSSVPPVSDSSSPTSPVDGDYPKPSFSRRLSSLPEGKRKSRLEDPHVQLARGLHYSLNQVYGPIRDLVRVLRGVSAKRTSTERTYYSALSFMEDLGKKLALLESREEENEDEDKRKSMASLHESCITCIKTFEHLALALKKNLRTLAAESNPQMIRTLMHLLYASLIEVRNSCLKLGDVDLRPITRDGAREFERGRQFLASQRRPVTSLRMRDQSSPMSNGLRANGTHGGHHFQKPPPSTDMSRTTSNTSLNMTATRGFGDHAPYGLATPALSRNNTFGSVEEEESRQFEGIWSRVNSASDLAAEALASCAMMLSTAKNFAASNRATDAEINHFDVLLDVCKRVRDGTEGLKRRLGAYSTRDPALSNNPDFWLAVTVFIREYLFFAGHIREGSKSVPSFPYEIRALLKPVHAAVKDLSHVINNSPWSHLAATHAQQPKSPRNQQGFLTSHPQQIQGGLHQAAPSHALQQHPQLSLQTRGPIPPANPSDPTSAVSMVSSNGNGAVSSGHVTPLPATPMSAALGPAALATMPMIPDLPTSTPGLGAGVLSNGITASNGAQQGPAGFVERKRSGSQRG